MRVALRLLALTVVIVPLAGCGADEETTGGTTLSPSAKKHAYAEARPDEVPCAQLGTRRAARALAAELVDRVVAPEDQPERQTIRVIAGSLYATCRQPQLPGVTDPGDYLPVRPVLREIQRDFDTDEILGH